MILNSAVVSFKRKYQLLVGFALILATSQAIAFPKTFNDWQARYNPPSATADNAACQTCHVQTNGGDPWNGYGWDIRNARIDPKHYSIRNRHLLPWRR